MTRRPELLAPAGGPDAGYAAFAFGADAVYAGLGRFSARAEAENFTADAFAELVAYAHTLSPPRRVYAAVNTLVKPSEAKALARVLEAAAGAGADALIVQDAGVAAFARRHFPGWRLHASTQLAVHNRAGARWASRAGFRRVVLARELSLREIARVAAGESVETEVFVHGALCYSYSGLCLFSSLTEGRSGNRGRCAYACRRPARRADGTWTHPFSLKDWEAGADARALADAGVTSLKIEGRKKSAAYVAAAVRLYRGILDGEWRAEEAEAAAVDLATVFARPTTKFFLRGAGPGPLDPAFVGHRGAPLGPGEVLVHDGRSWLCFRTPLALERHDGLQLELAGRERPYGFSVKELRRLSGAPGRAGFLPGARVFEASPGAWVAVALADDAPNLPAGVLVRLAASQAVKRRLAFPRPPAGRHGPRVDVSVYIRLAPDGVEAEASWVTPGGGPGAPAEGLRRTLRERRGGALSPAHEPAATAKAARKAFARLGATGLRLASFVCDNPDGLFWPPAAWNELRRAVAARVEEAVADARASGQRRLEEEAEAFFAAPAAPAAAADGVLPEADWTLFFERPDYARAFTPEDWAGVEEVILGLPETPDDADADKAWHAETESACAAFARARGWTRDHARARIRLAPPVLARDGRRDGEGVWRTRVDALAREGWTRWLAGNPWVLGLLPPARGRDVAGDWPLYALNDGARRAWREEGLSRVTFSPEADREALRALLAGGGAEGWVVVWHEPPLFLSAVCPGFALSDGSAGCADACRKDGADGCAAPADAWRVGLGRESARVRRGRAAVVATGARPLSWLGREGELRRFGARHFRVDFRWRAYTAGEARDVWRAVRNGGGPAAHEGNYERGLA